LDSFDGDMAFHLRQHDPKTITTAQQATSKVENNLFASRRLTQASSFRTKRESKENIVDVTISENEMTFMVDAMKRINKYKLSNSKIMLCSTK